MAGGSGTRLWPLSRVKTPKQALKLVGEMTMFEHAVSRLAPLFPPERICVVTRAEHAAALQAQAPSLPAQNFIIEPEGRGTAPAIGLGAVHLLGRDPQAVMTVLTADHYIQDTARFRNALAAALDVAGQDCLVTLGIKPTFPATGFGYIQQGDPLGQVTGFSVFTVKKFIEKPALPEAQKMVAGGEYSWNSGMFIWKVSTIMAEFQRQMPELFSQLQTVQESVGKASYEDVVGRIWPQVAKQTIDYGIMEGARDVVVIPVDIGWTDIGSWGSLFDLLPTDAEGNTFLGPHIAIDTSNSLVFGGNRLIATIGVQDMVVVDTEDALLICPKEREQEIRNIVNELQRAGQNQWL